MSHVHGFPPTAAFEHRRRLVAVLAIATVVLVVEVVGAVVTNSLALLADAGHMLADVLGIGLVLGAVWLARRPASGARTFGYLRLEILAAFANAAILIGIAVVILVEAIQRLLEPAEVASGLMLVVAVAGLAANAIGLALLRPVHRSSLTMRGAYLEVFGDLVASGGVILAALVISATGWTGVDTVVSMAIAVLILPRAWALLRDAIDVLLEAAPKGMRLEDVRSHILEADGVIDVHDLLAWTFTSGVDVVSAHVVIDDDADPRAVLDELCSCLSGDFDVEHSTFQLETADRRRLESVGHA